MTKITVGVLLYGDHTDLANRCLSSIMITLDPDIIAEVRICLNSVTSRTRTCVTNFAEFVRSAFGSRVGVMTLESSDGSNIWKYPLMRAALHGTSDLSPIPDDHLFTWFDDDSYVTSRTKQFWSDVVRSSSPPCVLGSIYRIAARSKQIAAIPLQSWYGGKPIRAKHVFRFCTGGWWTAPVSFLRKWDYPWPEIWHNGGDSILGELCRQQDLILRQVCPGGVAINADLIGRESAAKRRGGSTHWPWEHGVDSPKVCVDGLKITVLNSPSA